MLSLSRQIGRSRFGVRSGLRDEIIGCARLAVVVRPAVNGRNFSGPIAVKMFDRRSPFNRVRFPRILHRTFAAPDAVEKVGDKNKLSHCTENGKPRDEFIDVDDALEAGV